jgi:hypothetical protein
VVYDDRMRLATAWMNEEWYNDWIRTKTDPNWVSFRLCHTPARDILIRIYFPFTHIAT